MTEPQHGVVITFAQMYSEMQTMRGELQSMRADLRAALADNDDLKSDLKGRVTVLEEWKWKVTGMATAAGALAGSVAYLVTRGMGG